MLEKAVIEFNKYTDNFDRNDKDINLKYNHSLAVMDLMKELAFRLNFSKENIELAGLIGLLHDIGRFQQLKDFNSFSDKNVDHAEAGADFLFKDGHIRDYIEDNKYDSIIEKSIRNHNRYKIEDGLNDRELLFSKMIRDMDKVDIFKQHAVHYPGTFNAEEVTEEVLKEFKDEQPIDKNYRKTSSDGALLVLSFVFDINFNESYDILVETDNFDLYLSTVEVSENSEKLWNKIKEVCFDKINRGV